MGELCAAGGWTRETFRCPDCTVSVTADVCRAPGSSMEWPRVEHRDGDHVLSYGPMPPMWLDDLPESSDGWLAPRDLLGRLLARLRR